MPRECDPTPPVRPPQYVEEGEAPLQYPFFPDSEQAETLLYGDSFGISSEDIASRALAHVQGLRILATMRMQERAVESPQDPVAWNAEWLGKLTVKKVGAIGSDNQSEAHRAVQGLVQAEEAEQQIEGVGSLSPLENLRKITPGYICFEDIPLPPEASRPATKYRLAAAGYRWEDCYDRERRKLVRWYEPGVMEFFEDESNIPLVGSKEVHISLAELATLYNVARQTMAKLVKESKIETAELIIDASAAVSIKRSLLPIFDRFIDIEMPLPKPGDINYEELAEETGTKTSFLRALAVREGVRARPRRRPHTESSTELKALEDDAPLPPSTENASTKTEAIDEAKEPYGKHPTYFTSEDADTLRGAIAKYPYADDTDKTRGDVMEAVGFKTTYKFAEWVTQEELSWLKPKWKLDKANKLKNLETWTEGEATRIVQRIKQEIKNLQLAAHLIPHSAVAPLYGLKQPTILVRIKKHESVKSRTQKVRLGFYRKEQLCLTWKGLKQFASIYPDIAADIKIDYDRLPSGPDDEDPDRIAYARYLQAKLVPEATLGFDPKPYLKGDDSVEE